MSGATEDRAVRERRYNLVLETLQQNGKMTAEELSLHTLIRLSLIGGALQALRNRGLVKDTKVFTGETKIIWLHGSRQEIRVSFREWRSLSHPPVLITRLKNEISQLRERVAQLESERLA